MREETLRAIISARETLSKDMRNAAEGTRELRQAMRESGMESSEFIGALAVTEEQTESLENALEALSKDAAQTAVTQHAMAEGMEDAGQQALESAMLMELYESRVEETGEEAREATVENFGLASSLSAVATAAGQASVNIGPFNTNVRRAAMALPALIALVGSFTTVLFGMSVAALAAGGALAALFAGGLMGRANALAESSADIEGRMEALGEILSQVGSALDQVTQPIQDLATQQAAMDVLGGIVAILGDLAHSAARLAPLFGEVSDRLSATFWAEEAAGIAEIENMITELMPLLERLTFYILTNLPDLFRWLTDETRRVGPAMGDFFTSLVPVARELSHIGGTIFNLTLPALSILMDMIDGLLGLLAAAPETLVAASAAFAIATAAMVTYTGGTVAASIATWSLAGALNVVIGALATLLAPITWTIAGVAALIGAVVGVISYFGWWDDIIQGLVASWNALVESFEFGLNILSILSEKIVGVFGPLTLLMGPIGWLMYLMENWGKIMQTLDLIIESVKETWEEFVDVVMKYIDPLMKALGDATDKVDEMGGVSIEGAKLDTGGTSPGAGQEEARRRADSGSSQSTRQTADQIRDNRSEYNFDFSGANIGGSTSQRDIELAVEKALKDHDERNSDT